MAVMSLPHKTQERFSECAVHCKIILLEFEVWSMRVFRLEELKAVLSDCAAKLILWKWKGALLSFWVQMPLKQDSEILVPDPALVAMCAAERK